MRRILSDKEASKGFNPYWANMFWQEVAQLESVEAFEPDLRRVLVAAGYCGPGTVGSPKGPLRVQLDSLVATGAPPHGQGAAQALEPGWLSRAVDEGETWEDQLPPEMPRAAPEIYRSCRAAGASSIRDWLHRHYAGNKDDKNRTRVDLWNSATRVDFEIKRCKSGAEVRILLATNDSIEIEMRRLAAEEYQARTGDVVGAHQMLAVKAPGIGVDLAPSWLVNEVTAYSKAEHQRHERVQSSSRARGRGRGGGRPQQQGQAQPQGAAPGEQGGDAGGGRGQRGGRRGRA